MKILLPITLLIALLLQGCLSCYKCDRDDMEAKCIKPNDTIIFNQDEASGPFVHRYYNGGDSMINTNMVGYGGFEAKIEAFTDSGYSCSTYYTGHHSYAKNCRRGGDDDQWVDPAQYEYVGYSCRDYKGN